MLSHKIVDAPVLSQANCGAEEFTAIKLAASSALKGCEKLPPGQYKVWRKFLVSGGISVGEPVNTNTGPDTTSVLAFVLSKLPPDQVKQLAAVVSAGGASVTPAQRQMAIQICEPTRKHTVRAGAISGVVELTPIQ